MDEHLTDHRHWVLPEVLTAAAAARGEQELVTVIGEGSLTYAQANLDAGRVAAHCAAAGVRPGDAVAVLLPNGLDFIRLWLGLGRLGAVIVPVNTALTGEFLAHQLRQSGARFVVASAEAGPAVTQVLPAVRAGGTDVAVLALDGWSAPGRCRTAPRTGRRRVPDVHLRHDGPVQGRALMPHAHCYLFGLGSVEGLALTESDRYYVSMPLFHANGLFMPRRRMTSSRPVTSARSWSDRGCPSRSWRATPAGRRRAWTPRGTSGSTPATAASWTPTGGSRSSTAPRTASGGAGRTSRRTRSSRRRPRGGRRGRGVRRPRGTEGTEDEVMLAVVPVPGIHLDPAAVAEYADRVVPRFARPRYVEVVDALPRTPTQKVRKQDLRQRAVTSTTWDRLADASRPS